MTASVSRLGAGVAGVVQSLSRSLAAIPGSQVTVLGLRDAYTEDDHHLWGDVDLRVFKPSIPPSFGYSAGFMQCLAHLRPDVVHLHGIWMYPSVAARSWASRGGVPLIISPHGMLDPWALQYSAWKKRLAAWLYERDNLNSAACTHAVSGAEALACREYGLRMPIAILPNGVSLPTSASPDPPPWASLSPHGAKVLLYLGRLHPKKGLLNLLRAWKQALRSPRDSEWRLVISGWSQNGHERALRELASALGIQGSVLFLGPLYGAQKEAAFSNATALVLPSLSEGLPVVVLEAWSYGLPVVMTPQCNLPEGFRAGAAISAEPDPAQLARALISLMRLSDSERQSIGERGRSLTLERFSWLGIAAKMREVYRWMVDGGPLPPCVRSD